MSGTEILYTLEQFFNYEAMAGRQRLIHISLIVLLLVLLHLFYSYLKSKANKNLRWVEFDYVGKKMGLLAPQREIMRRLLNFSPQKKPSNVFTCVEVFDDVVTAAIQAIEKQGAGHTEVEMLASELKNIRQKLHFDRVRIGTSLRNTRELSPGPTKHILSFGNGVSAYGVVTEVDDLVLTYKMEYHSEFGKLVKQGTKVHVSFVLSNDARYSFDSVVMKDSEGDDPVLLQHPERIHRVQGRQFYRYEMRLPVTFVPAKVPDRKNLKNVEYLCDPSNGFQGHTLDLSGGGLCLLCTKQLSLGEMVLLRFPMEHRVFEVLGEVVVQKPLRAGDYKYGIEFVGINRQDTETIVAFISRREREDIKAKNQQKEMEENLESDASDGTSPEGDGQTGTSV